MLMCLCGCGLFKTKIDLENYITYSYDGIDGYTSIEYSLDVERMKNDFKEKVSEKKIEAFNTLMDSLEINASKTDNLQNGDVVVLSVKFSEENCKSASVKFVGNDMEIDIEGLREGEVLDLFADITVNVKGIAPLAVASIDNKSTNEFVKGLTYTLDKTTGFQPGDILTVSCNVDEKVAEEAGYVILNKSKSYSTEGIEGYVDSPESLNYSKLSEVAVEAKNVVMSETEDSQTRMLYKLTESSNFLFQYNKEWIDSIELQEIRLLTGNVACAENGLPYNKLYIIFKAYVTNADHGTDGYFCFEYNDLMISTDGSMVINHENQNMRYLCDDDLAELMTKVQKECQGIYIEQNVDLSLISLADLTVEEEIEANFTDNETEVGQN